MKISVGYEMAFECEQPTPMLLTVNVHPSRSEDLIVPDRLQCEPAVPVHGYLDQFGNRCSRIVAPAGGIRLTASGVVRDSGAWDIVRRNAAETPVEDLPNDVLVYLLGSRYCETDRLMSVAWKLFSATPRGHARVQAICDFVHRHIRFGYSDARATRTAVEAYEERVGVCRDFTHLAVAFCRCMNIPARYCTGYITDIGLPPQSLPMDFCAWFEAYLDGEWHAFDPRNNAPRIGRILMARGRDATDVAITNSFGATKLTKFRVWADEHEPARSASSDRSSLDRSA